MNLLECVVIEDAHLKHDKEKDMKLRKAITKLLLSTHLHVVRACDDPVFAGDEASAANRKIANLIKELACIKLHLDCEIIYLKIFHHLLIFVVHDMNVTIV